jgi:hypothetical protein
MAQLGVSLSAMGYLSMAMKDILKGEEPRNPLDPKTMAEAFVRGGTAGLYGDFIFGEYHKGYRSFASDLAGPTFSTIDQFSKIYSEMREAALTGDSTAAERAGKKLLKFTINNVPGNNVFYVRPALDYLFLNELQDNLSPGYLDRRRQRLLKEGRDYFMPRTVSGP